eukprot:7049893-Pyramimonas_sp.AAC.2
MSVRLVKESSHNTIPLNFRTILGCCDRNAAPQHQGGQTSDGRVEHEYHMDMAVGNFDLSGRSFYQ